MTTTLDGTRGRDRSWPRGGSPRDAGLHAQGRPPTRSTRRPERLQTLRLHSRLLIRIVLDGHLVADATLAWIGFKARVLWTASHVSGRARREIRRRSYGPHTLRHKVAHTGARLGDVAAEDAVACHRV